MPSRMQLSQGLIFSSIHISLIIVSVHARNMCTIVSLLSHMYRSTMSASGCLERSPIMAAYNYTITMENTNSIFSANHPIPRALKYSVVNFYNSVYNSSHFISLSRN